MDTVQILEEKRLIDFRNTTYTKEKLMEAEHAKLPVSIIEISFELKLVKKRNLVEIILMQ